MRKIDYVATQMTHYGDIDCPQEYLETSEANILLHGVKIDGDSALILAARERYPEIVGLLLDKGTDPDFQNKTKRTALMEAALYGQVDNVAILLERGAEKDLKDHRGFKAIDLARTVNHTQKTLSRQFEDDIVQEVEFRTYMRRGAIIDLLEENAVETNRTDHESSKLESAFYVKSSADNGIKLVQLTLVSNHILKTLSKTVAHLDRGGRFPTETATSGWSRWTSNLADISGTRWTEEVFCVARTVGHQLQPRQNFDHRKQGQYYASHAEAQLIAFFVSRHVILEDVIDSLVHRPENHEERPGGAAMGGSDNVQEADGKARKEAKLRDLIVPPVTLREARIFVSATPCVECKNFCRLVNEKYGLRLELVDRSAMTLQELLSLT